MADSDSRDGGTKLVGASECFERTIAVLKRFAWSDVPLLIYGETGTGKELFARAAHYNSLRREFPFVPVNCGGLPESLVENEMFGHVRGAYTDAKAAQGGLIALAEGGTLFLDEVDSLSIHAQVSLLRFLQDRQYRPVGSDKAKNANVRIVAATNANLKEKIAQNLFRQDLLFRLDVAALTVPPLRERREDILLLAEHFLHRFSRQHGKPRFRINEKGRQALLSHGWPGNVRELENVIHRTVLLTDGDCIDSFAIGPSCDNSVAELSADASEGAASSGYEDGLKRAKARCVANFERDYLRWLLNKNHGNISAAARAAGTERRYLGRMIKRAGLSASAFRARAE